MSIFLPDIFAGKVAIVTGGGSGINQRIAVRFAELGASVCVIGRRQDKLDETVAIIRQIGQPALGLSCDIREADLLAEQCAAAHAELGEIDILVCGAAGNFPSPAADMSSKGFKAVIEIDVIGTFNTAKAAFPYLKKPGASIINISAIQAILPVANQIHVNAAKAGVDMITRTLALEWSPLGIRVNSIAPGPVAETEGMDRLAPGDQLEAMAAQIPLRRVATKDDVADLAVFLSSSAAANITGAIMVSDGGQHLVGYEVDTGASAKITKAAAHR
jgi:NAD(P)-dependent dehydrogenase (short-subunit alcohol dehydrogenase family)